jgi:hypothetical protein
VYVGGCSTYGCRPTAPPGAALLEIESDGDLFPHCLSFLHSVLLFLAMALYLAAAGGAFEGYLAVAAFWVVMAVFILEAASTRTAILDIANGNLELWSGGLATLAGPEVLALDAPRRPGRRVRAYPYSFPRGGEAIVLDVCDAQGEQLAVVATVPRSEWPRLRGFGEHLATALKGRLEICDAPLR